MSYPGLRKPPIFPPEQRLAYLFGNGFVRMFPMSCMPKITEENYRAAFNAGDLGAWAAGYEGLMTTPLEIGNFTGHLDALEAHARRWDQLREVTHPADFAELDRLRRAVESHL